MPSALETLVKILKLEQDTGYLNKAVIGGLQSFASHWATDAHAQAKKPEHHLLVDELAGLLGEYGDLRTGDERHDAIKYMLGRIIGRVPPRDVQSGTSPSVQTSPAPAVLPATQVEAPRPPVPETRPPAAQSTPERLNVETQSRAEPRIEPRTTQVPRSTEVRPHQNQRPEHRPWRAERDDGDEETLDTGMADVDSGGTAGDLDVPGPVPSRPRRAETPRMLHPPRRRRGPRDPQREIGILNSLRTPAMTLHGVGPKLAEKLAQLEIHTIEDLLYCFPRRYDDYTRLLPLHRLRPDQVVTVIGTVRNSVVIKGKRGQDILNVVIEDGTGKLTATFFGQPYLQSTFQAGAQVVFSGKTDLYLGKVVMNHPEWELMEREALHTRGIVPVYPLTTGLSAHTIRKIARGAVDQWAGQVPDPLPDSVLERVDLAELGWALRQIHFPESPDGLGHAQRRLAFDEMILLQLGVLRNRREWQSQPASPISVDEDWLQQFVAALPYALTGAQQRAIAAIREDLSRSIPMTRLLQGDVGAGKTVVAAIAMSMAVATGHQAALMAPTSILAEQHYRSLRSLISSVPGGEAINIKLLTSATSTQERDDILWGLGEGSVQIVIGTHALIQDDVHFWRLGLAVIDEQHRFGVEQRGKLRAKGVGTNPHVLVMTATPIPRTLALTLYADLDLTVLDEMPPGRIPIDTRVLFRRERETAYRYIETQISKGRQAFIVYPLIEDSESDTMADVRSATEEFERLRTEVFHRYTLGLLHGRMSPSEKDAIMSAFSQGEMNILVSTSVVEVGIDVPNASVMLIEGAERFGLAQLHQLRGRVGRGEHPSACLLIASDGTMDNERLKAMESTTDGFKLAEMDWKMRGAGDLLGTRQAGASAVISGRLSSAIDIKLVSEAQIEARTIYEEDPDLAQREHATLRERLRLRYGDQPSADVS